MARRPPRRPRQLANLDLEAGAGVEKEEEEEGENSKTKAGGEDERVDDALCQDMRLPQRGIGKRPYAMDSELARAGTPERPMRRVVVSSPRRAGSSPKAAHSPKHPRTQKPADASRPIQEESSALPVAEETKAKVPTRHRRIVVNDTSYRILRKLGRGGSGRVYEVMAPDTRTWAFKAIPLAALDDRARRQIRNEVALLQSLRGMDRVVHLRDWCIDEAKNAIHIVMELGQIDLETIIRDHVEREEKLDAVFVGYYWREMLRSIAAIHALDVVHSDIKPANFVSIRGVLKIVDFGIAHSLPDDTVNIYVDHLSGTPNYMAPETVKVLSSSSSSDSEDVSTRSRVVKIGKPSDMWSLGCVLHLMVYGRQPFAHIRGMAPKLLAIADASGAAVELEHHARTGW
ncbi:hypothetical protein PWT90_11235 [Aphanocladium album]|nr:hypothetical protein PWT90_11235 [Aphanocladium album]